MNLIYKNTLLIVVSTLIVKVLSVSNQFILGFLLEVNHFGYYATAIGASSIFIWLKDGAIMNLVIREHVTGNHIYYKGYVTLFNIVSSLLVFLIALLYVEEGSYIWQVVIAIAFTQLFSYCGLKNRIQLIVNNDYKALSIYEIKFGLTLSLITIFSAFFFNDERCFAIGLLAALFYEIIVFLIREKCFHIFELKGISFYDFWPKSKWLLLGAVGSTLVMKGGFIVLGIIDSAYVVGLYYFSFQLASSISLLLGESVRKVIMPYIAKEKQHSQQLKIYGELLIYFSILLIPLSIALKPLIAPVITYFWQDKWLDAIYPAELFISTMFMSILISLSYSQLEAAGQWKSKNLMQVFDGVALIVAAIVGAKIGGIEMIALCVILRRLILGGVQIILPFYLQNRFDFSIVIKLIMIAFFSVILNYCYSSVFSLLFKEEIIVNLFCLIFLVVTSFITVLKYKKIKLTSEV